MLITTAPRKEKVVYDALRTLPAILEVHPIFGEYDFIAKIDKRAVDKLGKFVAEKIKRIPGVIHTKMLTGTKL